MATGGGDKIWTWKKPPPPSKAILRIIFKNTTDLIRLCNYLSIPYDKWDVDSAVEFYARSTDPVKMRDMIIYLDLIGDTALAESVMDYAEPPADPSLNPLLLTPVFQAITGDVGKILPPARVALFHEKFSDPGQVNAEAGKYCALYHYYSTWRRLAVELYSAGETKAAQMARHHVHVVTVGLKLQCPCSPGNVHTATPNKAHSKLICTRTERKCRGGLTAGQRVWLGPGNTPVASGSDQASAVPSTATTSEYPTSHPPSSQYSSSRLTEKPSLPILLNFPTGAEGTMNIITEVGSSYEMLGTLLLNDHRGVILPAIREEKQGNVTNITMEIMRRWVNGKGKKPVTWQTLTLCLNSVGLSDLASSIELSL